MVYHEGFGTVLRLGNWLFQYAATIALCKKHNCETTYPDYWLWKYLQNPPLIGEEMKGEIIRPRVWEWSKEEEEYLNSFDFSKDWTLALNFFFQSANWFKGYEKEVLTSLEIKEEEKNKVAYKYDYIFNKQPTIGISIRLGDFVGNGVYYQIPFDWYIKALDNFPNWQERPVVVFSDDIEKAKSLFKGYPFYYADSNQTHLHSDNFKYYHSEKAIEQFILGTMIDDWIIGSSTFSWWIAWICSQKSPLNRVVHSGEVFSKTGDYAHCDTSNYYHSDWIRYPV